MPHYEMDFMQEKKQTYTKAVLLKKKISTSL